MPFQVVGPIFGGRWAERPPLVLQTLGGVSLVPRTGTGVSPTAELLFPLVLAVASGREGRSRALLGAFFYPEQPGSEQLRLLRKRLSRLRTHLPAEVVDISPESVRLTAPLAVDIDGPGWWSAYLATRTLGDRLPLAMHPLRDAFSGTALSTPVAEMLESVDADIRAALWRRFSEEFSHAAFVAALPTAVAVVAITDYLACAGPDGGAVRAVLDAAVAGGQVGAACLAVSEVLRAMPTDEDLLPEHAAVANVLRRWIHRMAEEEGGVSEVVLEGRAVELCELMAAHGTLGHGPGVRFVVVGGASGMGRTTLLRVFTRVAKRARGGAALVLSMQLRAVMKAQPFSGFQALVHALNNERGAGGTGDAAHRILQKILRDPLSAATLGRRDVIGAFHEMVAAVIEDTPTKQPAVVLAIDDVQWLDLASQELLFDVVEAFASLPMMVVLSATDPALVAHVLDGRPVVHIAVDPLTDAEARGVFAQRLSGKALTDQEVAHLNRVAGGRPRDLVRLANGLRAHGMPAGRLGDTMGAYVAANMQAMAPAVRNVLTVAAMLGPLAHPERIQGVAVLGEEESVPEALAILEREGWVESAEHPVVADALTEHILAGWHPQLRRMLWAQVAHALDAEWQNAVVPRPAEIPWQIVRAWDAAGDSSRAINAGMAIGAALLRAQFIAYGEEIFSHVESVARRLGGVERVWAVRRAWLVALVDVQRQAKARARVREWQAVVAADPLARSAHLALEAFYRWYTGDAVHGLPPLLDNGEAVSDLTVPAQIRIALFTEAVVHQWFRGDECTARDTAGWVLRLPVPVDSDPLDVLVVLRGQLLAAALLRCPESLMAVYPRYRDAVAGAAQVHPVVQPAAVLDAWMCQQWLGCSLGIEEDVAQAKQVAMAIRNVSFRATMWAIACVQILPQVLESHGPECPEPTAAPMPLEALRRLAEEWCGWRAQPGAAALEAVFAPLVAVVSAVLEGSGVASPRALPSAPVMASGWWWMVTPVDEAPRDRTWDPAPPTRAGHPLAHRSWRGVGQWIASWRREFIACTEATAQGLAVTATMLADLAAVSEVLWQSPHPHPALVHLWQWDLRQARSAQVLAALYAEGAIAEDPSAPGCLVWRALPRLAPPLLATEVEVMVRTSADGLADVVAPPRRPIRWSERMVQSAEVAQDGSEVSR